MDAPENKKAEDFDVVLLHGPTDDGEGARVLRARPGRVDSGEVRPLREGKALAAGGEVVRLSPRQGAPAVFDVAVEYKVPAAESRAHDGPAQVATSTYRTNWDVTFGARAKDVN